jgi:hypothetical protein
MQAHLCTSPGAKKRSEQPPSQVWRLASSIRWHAASGVGSAPPRTVLSLLRCCFIQPSRRDRWICSRTASFLLPPRIRGHSSPHPYPLHLETFRLHESGPSRGSAGHRQPSPYPRTVGLYRLTKSSCGNLTIITRHKHTAAASVSA